jgi:LmbE family N-acetylglucosaminyl deacetylase
MATILSIHAHPDDAEILAGGTLGALGRSRPPDHHRHFYPRRLRFQTARPEEIAAVRRREAANAAALIGARYFCLEMRDLAIFNDDASRRLVTETLRQTRPDLVLAAAPSDYHCDHEAASALVRDACFAAPAPNYRTRAASTAPPLDHIPHLYFMDPVEGRERDGRAAQPDFVVDIGKLPSPASAPCWPSTRASASGCANTTEPTITSMPWNAGPASAARSWAYPSAKASACTKVTPTRKLACWRNFSDRLR